MKWKRSKGKNGRERRKEKERGEMEGAEESARKIMRNGGETRGDLTRDVSPGEGFKDAEGRMVDSVDAVEWMETLDDIAMHKTPVIRMNGSRNARIVKACETQFIGGGI